MARIAIGGMQHETNTFAPSKADYAAFEAGGGWPGVKFGGELFDAVAGGNYPVEGAIGALRSARHNLVPLAWAVASPSAHVTDDAFERIVGELCRRLREAGPLDGVYLDLHGAMVTESHDDGEGELLARVREIVGPRVPVVASLDLHANVTRRMVETADAMSIYRTYPHVDMADTGARAAHLLQGLMKSGRPFHKTLRRFDYLTGLPSQSTFIEPAKSLYGLLNRIDVRTGVGLSFAMGFPMADFDECGMTVIGYGEPAITEQAVRELGDAIDEAEKDFAMTLYPAADAVRRAKSVGRVGRPAVIADTQDNPGAGGNGDTPGLLRALLELEAQDAVLGLLIDAPAAAQAHEMGPGASAEFSLGARSGLPGHEPVCGRFTVERLGDGEFTCTGPMFKNFRMHLGPMALLRSGGVRVVLASRKCQAGDQEMFRHVGVEPASQKIVALKSSVHFRADFQPIASEIIVAQAPGPSLADPAGFDWKNLRPGIRLNPLGPAFAPAR
ncbi:MAG: M81 family metallopeptidase [Burkholderiaceae bacterium]